jgi:hypothetical protein
VNVELVPALAAGTIGGLVMLFLQVVGRSIGGPRGFDLTAMWATLLGLPGQRAVGVAVHLVVSAAIAVLYALGFRMAGVSDIGWAWGLTASVIHWIVAGLFVGAAPASGLRETSVPGPFAMRLGGATAVGFLLAHLVFGLIVGVAYFSLHTGGGFDAAV